MSPHPGSCHCGAVSFRVDGEITELTTCDCSLCVKRNAVMTKVPRASLTVLEGEGALTLYRWNTGIARHYFCRHCGVYLFHAKRAAPDHYGVNIFALDGFDPSALPVRATDGAGMSLKAGGARPRWPGPRA